MFLGNFTYVDLFSGVGGFRQALDKLGGKCVMASEIDKFANKAYEVLYGHKTVGDVTKIVVEDVPDHDLLVAGVPCQPWSVAGKRKGFDDERGMMWSHVDGILKAKKPKAFIIENVKGLLSHNKGESFIEICENLSSIGYLIDFQVLNSKYFGVPQNRERIYLIGISEDLV